MSATASYFNWPLPSSAAGLGPRGGRGVCGEGAPSGGRSWKSRAFHSRPCPPGSARRPNPKRPRTCGVGGSPVRASAQACAAGHGRVRAVWEDGGAFWGTLPRPPRVRHAVGCGRACGPPGHTPPACCPQPHPVCLRIQPSSDTRGRQPPAARRPPPPRTHGAQRLCSSAPQPRPCFSGITSCTSPEKQPDGKCRP